MQFTSAIYTLVFIGLFACEGAADKIVDQRSRVVSSVHSDSDVKRIDSSDQNNDGPVLPTELPLSTLGWGGTEFGSNSEYYLVSME